jgi:hypothetical protein
MRDACLVHSPLNVLFVQFACCIVLMMLCSRRAEMLSFCTFYDLRVAVKLASICSLVF